MRPVFHLFERMRQAKARKLLTAASRALTEHRDAPAKATYAAQHTRLSLELGRGPDAWRGR